MNFRAQTILAENLCCNREIGVIPDQLTKKKLSAFPGHNVEKTSWTTFHSWPSFMTQSWAKLKKNAKKGFKKFVKLLDHTCVCNDFTNFECEGQATGNGSYVNLQKLAWKNSWKSLWLNFFQRVFCHLEPLYDAKLDRHHHSYIYFFFCHYHLYLALLSQWLVPRVLWKFQFGYVK